jgi:hypothetical protein
VFLLSTRAGGQGITLTAADNCIIYDSGGLGGPPVIVVPAVVYVLPRVLLPPEQAHASSVRLGWVELLCVWRL